MRIPYETAAIGREYIALETDVTAAILLTLQRGWAIAGITTKHATAGEVVITERLSDGMRAAINSGQYPWSKSFIIAPGTESRSSLGVATPDGRTDIPIYLIEVFLRYGEHDPTRLLSANASTMRMLWRGSIASGQENTRRTTRPAS